MLNHLFKKYCVQEIDLNALKKTEKQMKKKKSIAENS